MRTANQENARLKRVPKGVLKSTSFAWCLKNQQKGNGATDQVTQMQMEHSRI